MCSTPFGIIGILTHFVSRDEYFSPGCAQRLSASSEFSLNTTPAGFHYNDRAQRLSASSEFSPSLSFLAKRALKCSTPFGIIGILTNQRLSKEGRCLGCSTPFGIIGILTVQALRETLNCCCVLKDIRHHRYSHLII